MFEHKQFETLSGEQTRAADEERGKSTLLIEYYTDPLCSWSWAFEAQWRRLRYECGNLLEWRYRMGGLLSDWRSYDDPFNDIRHPSQMGPQWFQVRKHTGMPLDERIWHLDPPSSSYPACVAVKAAECQGQNVGEAYLRRVREAAMMECRNVALQEVLLDLAQHMAQEAGSGKRLDFPRFCADLNAPETVEAFRQDLRDVAYKGIGRFPTLILHSANRRPIMLVGYRPYDVLWAALSQLVPHMPRRQAMPPEELVRAYVHSWGCVTLRECAVILDSDIEQAATLVESLVARDLLRPVERERGEHVASPPRPDEGVLYCIGGSNRGC